MRKILAFVLLAVLGLPSALPLFAAVRGDADAGLPACCRRLGKHHCAMQDAAAAAASTQTDRAGADDGHGKAVRTAGVMRAGGEACPYRCAMVAPAHADSVLLGSASGRVYAAVLSHPAVQAQTESRWRVARERARGKRGPPVRSGRLFRLAA